MTGSLAQSGEGMNIRRTSGRETASRRKLRMASRGRLRLAAVSVAAISMFASHAANAANTPETYTGGASGELDATGSWSQGVVPTVSYDALINGSTTLAGVTLNAGAVTFGSLNDTDSGAVTITSSQILTLGGTGDLGDAISGSNSGDLLYVGSSSTLNYNITGSGSIAVAQPGNLDIAGTAAISAPISGSNGFTKTGSGTLNLTGAETITGSLIVNAGTLSLTGTGVSLASGAGIVLNNGGTFSYGASPGGAIDATAAGETNTINVLGGPNTAATIAGYGFSNGSTSSGIQLLVTGNGNLTWSIGHIEPREREYVRKLRRHRELGK